MKIVATQASEAAQGWTAIADAALSTTQEAQTVSATAGQLTTTVAEINRQVELDARLARRKQDQFPSAVSARSRGVPVLGRHLPDVEAAHKAYGSMSFRSRHGFDLLFLTVRLLRLFQEYLV